MKTNKLIIFILAITSITFNSCVEDGDFTVPEDLGQAENEAVTNIITEINNGTLSEITISNLKTLFVQDEATEITQDIIVKGYVTSSDRTGNFFKEIFIQDSPTEPTAAIKVALDLNDTYNKFNFGREVYVNLKGLFIGETRTGNGVITIGSENGDTVDDIFLSRIDNHVFRSATTATIEPLQLSISEVSDENIGMFVQIINAQFSRNLLGLSFVDSEETFDTQRTIETCEGVGSLLLETSSFANFGFSPLPDFQFSMDAVVSKTFNGSDIVLVLNDQENFENTGERCDPDFLECTGASGGNTIIYSENFESFNGFSSEGWGNINIDDKSTDWEIGAFGGTSYAQITAFNSGEESEKVWLITPAINMNNSTEEELSFDIQANFDNGQILSVFVSTDYVDDPETATWQLLDVNVPSGPASGFGSFTGVNPINISCIDGENVRIGFLYESSDPGATTRYHIDNIEISGN